MYAINVNGEHWRMTRKGFFIREPRARPKRPWSSPVPNISSANKLRPTPDTLRPTTSYDAQGIRCVCGRFRRWFNSNRVHGEVDMPKETSAKSTDSLPLCSVSSAVSTGSYKVSTLALGNNSRIAIQLQLWAVCSVHVCFRCVSSKARTGVLKCPS